MVKIIKNWQNLKKIKEFLIKYVDILDSFKNIQRIKK